MSAKKDRPGGETEATMQPARAITEDTPEGYCAAGFTASERDEESYQIRCAVRRDVGVVAGAIFDVIVHRACGDGDVMVAFSEIADEAGVSVRTVRRGVERLCDSGWLTRQPPQTAEGGGPRLSTWFTIPPVRKLDDHG